MTTRGAVPFVVLGVCAQAGAAQAQPSLDEVLARAGAYVVRFEQTFSSVVAEEHYRQRLRGPAPPLRLDSSNADRRELKSDFLMVRSDQMTDWIPFRDVFEVDGRPVRDREERLTKLFLEQPDVAVDQAWRVTEESSRYNIGPVVRTVNVPTQALRFLAPDDQRRSSFEKAREARIDGLSVWEVRFQEVAVPTLIKTHNGMSLPANGSFWIDPVTGVVVRTLVRTRSAGLRAEISVTFRPHETIDVPVPAELKEKYIGTYFELEGTARYSRFRRFKVTTEEVIKDGAGRPLQQPGRSRIDTTRASAAGLPRTTRSACIQAAPAPW